MSKLILRRRQHPSGYTYVLADCIDLVEPIEIGIPIDIIGSNRYTLDHEYALKQGEVKHGPSD